MRLSYVLLGMQLAGGAVSAPAQAISAELRGSWTIDKVLPAVSPGRCWDTARAGRLVGTKLYYQGSALVWNGTTIHIASTVRRTVSEAEYLADYRVHLTELGVHAASITELDLQHEDADITGATTEFPGDTVFMAAPGRLIVEVCGVFFSAARAGNTAARR